LENDGSFGPAVLVPELSSSGTDNFPTPRPDGLEMFFTSNRPDALGGFDLWVSTRPSTSAPWSTPLNVGSVVNSTANELGATMSFARNYLIFHSNRPDGKGGADLYVTTRMKTAGASAPAISDGGVVNAATYSAGPLAPNSFVAIFGTNLATVSAAGETAAGHYPISLFGTRVTFGSTDAELLYISPLQINAVVPSGLAPGSGNVTVTVDGATSPPQAVTIGP
jgi:WD40-like Beta Propeller Repeat/IPT/TIG domain